MRTNCQRIKADIEALARFTSTPGRGVTRLSFTEEDRLAREYIKAQMASAGLRVFEDTAGTLIGRREGTNPGAGVIMMGSHMDTVKHGGAFDGAAGVAAAIEVARVINQRNMKNQNPIEVAAMTEEEGTRFNNGMLSSEAMAGTITNEALDVLKDDQGTTLREAMQSFGISPDLEKARRSDIKAFIELHIEQGPMLENKNADIGVVENIVGLSIHKVTVTGKSGHAGTTPMHLRSDALLAAAYTITAITDIVNRVGEGAVATVGKIMALPGASNVIADHVEFSVDIRSSAEANIKKVRDRMCEEARAVKDRFKVDVKVERTSYNKPVKLSRKIGDLIEEVSEGLGFTSLRLNSGAGHDAMAIAGIADTGMIFVPCRNGISHSPDEWADYESVQKGAEVLLSVVEKLSGIS